MENGCDWLRARRRGTWSLVVMAWTLLVLKWTESIPDVDVLWAIPLAIIALILGGLLIHRTVKRDEQRLKKAQGLR